jgi:predicted RNA-binding protein YlxR (DUF448 family)
LCHAPDGGTITNTRGEKIENYREMRRSRHRPKAISRKVRPAKPKNRHRPKAVNTDLCDTVSELARKIAFHFQNQDGSSKLQFELDRQTISDWKRGKRLDNSPPPPARVNSRQWSAKQWIDWFIKYHLEKWKISNGTQSVDDIRVLKQQDEKEALQFKKFERERARGLYITVDEHNRIALEMGTILNHAITEHGERELTKELETTVKSLNIPEDQKQTLLVGIRESALKAVDGLREAIRNQVIASQTKEQAP